jgi:2-hydroxychromene-2-carboxylate isomerase
MPRQVDYYFSFSSPWAYIGHKAFRDVVAAHDLKVNHKPVVLVDLFSETGGLPLIKRHPVRQRYRMVELQRWRDKRGLNFHFQPKYIPLNARLADGVVIAAVEAGLDPDPFLRRAFPAVWEEELNLADPAVIAKLADEAGLPGKKAGRTLRLRGDQRRLRAEPAGRDLGRCVRLAGLCARGRGVLGAGPDRIARRRIEIRTQGL